MSNMRKTKGVAVGRESQGAPPAARSRTFFAGLLLALLAGPLLSGCMLQVKRNVEATARAGAIIGSVTYGGAVPADVVVVAVADPAGTPRVENYANLKPTGRYILLLAAGRSYDVVAFSDRNRNLRLDPGEPCGISSTTTLTPDEDGYVSVDLTLESGRLLPEKLSAALAGLPSITRRPLPVVVGNVADLSDPRFSAANGEKGLWQPFDFITETGIGVYFLEPYDPDKIPVLFVNGAGGSPQDWTGFFRRIDRSRFQPWFFLYPSGARLERSAETLASIVARLREQHRFDRLHVVAHSMGGLVARGFIDQALDQGRGEFITQFITISTPWQGHAGAWYGVEMAPATIPSWIDMVPGSDYQKGLFARKIGDKVPCYLLFGYRGGSAIFSDYSDGTVTLGSQLFFPAQEEARKVYGFNENHTSILTSGEVLSVVNHLLQDNDPHDGASGRAPSHHHKENAS